MELTERRTSEAHVEELFPGIPDNVTLDHITTKVPWRDIYLLSSVSRGWHQAIQCRHVYHARVRCNSTETFVLVHHSPDEEFDVICLCSMRDKSCHTLPPIVNNYNYRKMPRSEFVTLDGRVYAFARDCRLYVLDLAGQRSGKVQWKECASMENPFQLRGEVFECCVMDGKIYVLRGTTNPQFPAGSVVYDPKQNTWSPIKPMPSLRRNFQVAAVEDGLVMYGGSFYFQIPNRTRTEYSCEPVDFLEVYNPVKDEWRVVEAFGRPNQELFGAGGKFYSISWLGIYVYDFRGNSWAHQHSFSFSAIVPVQFQDSIALRPLGTLGVDNELLAALKWYEGFDDRSCLVQSIGLGSVSKEIVWQKVEFSISFKQLASIHPIQL